MPIMEKEETTEDESSLNEALRVSATQGESNEPSKAETQTRNTLTSDSKTVTKKADEDDWEYITGFKLLIVIATVTLTCFLMLLDTSIVVTAIPQITSEFHSLSDIGWYGSSYLLANCALQPMTGKIYTRFSSKYTFISFLAIFELGSLLCSLANSSNMLIVGRAVAGLGGSGLMNGALTIIAVCVPLEKRAVNLGIAMSFGQLGILFGPLIGGALTEYANWRWCFRINIPVGATMAIILIFIQIPERKAKTTLKATLRSTLHSLDLFGIALFAPTAIMCLLALESGGIKYSWNSGIIIGLFCGSAGNLALFLAWEYKRGDTAMIPLSMVKQRIVWTSCVVMFFFAGSMMMTLYYLSIYFQAIRGVSPTLSGVYLLPGILSQMLFAPISGFLVGRLGYYLPWITSGIVLTSISSGLISTFTPTTNTGTWIGYQIIGGVGRGCGIQMSVVAIQNHLPASQNSVGMSLVIFSQTFGGAMFLSLAQTAFLTGLVNALPILAPKVSPQTVINAGATGFRAVIPKALIEGVVLAYSQAISYVFYIAAGAAVAAFFFSWGMGWKSVKKAKTVAPEA